MGHQLAEMTTGLASRVNNLAVSETGNQCRQLLEQQDKLAKLAMAAIVKDLSEERAEYNEAIKSLSEAIKFIGEADKGIEGVAKSIKLTAKAISAVEKVLKAVV